MVTHKRMDLCKQRKWRLRLKLVSMTTDQQYSSYFVVLEMERHHPDHTPGSLTYHENCNFYMCQWCLGYFGLVNKNKQSFKKCSNFLNDTVVTGWGKQLLSEKWLRVKFVTAHRMNDVVLIIVPSVLSYLKYQRRIQCLQNQSMCTYVCLCIALAEWISFWLYNW